MADKYITKMDGNVWSENVPPKCATSIKRRRFWYHIRVLFIVVVLVCSCVVMDRHTKIQYGA